MMNSVVFRETMDNMRQHRDIKLATNEASESNYHKTIFFRKHISNRNEKNLNINE